MANESVHVLEPATVTRAQAVWWYLHGEPTGDPPHFFSSYHAALRDARNVTGRDAATGTVVRPINTATWLGAVGYLCFLDQLGSAIRRKRKRASKKVSAAQRPSAIERCIADFDDGATSVRDRHALWALRCSLAHHYSLFNDGGRSARAKDLQFRFRLVADTSSKLVHHATTRWHGDLTQRHRQSEETSINLRALGDLVEALHRNVQQAASLGQVESRLPAGELLTRYFVFSSVHP